MEERREKSWGVGVMLLLDAWLVVGVCDPTGSTHRPEGVMSSLCIQGQQVCVQTQQCVSCWVMWSVVHLISTC